MSGRKPEKALSERAGSNEGRPSQEGLSESKGKTLIGDVSDALDGVSENIGDIVDGVKDDLDDIKDDLGELRDEVKGGIDDASAAVRRLEDSFAEDALQNKRFPKVMRIFGGLLVAGGLLHCLEYLIFMGAVAFMVYEGYGSVFGEVLDGQTILGMVFSAILFVLVVVSAVVSVSLGIRLLKNNRNKAARFANVLMLIEAVSLVFSFMLYGFSASTFISVGYVIFLGLLSVYSDPTLRRERLAKRKAVQLEDKQDQEAGVLGLDKTGKGYIELDFFNLFWIFVVCCFLGLIIETVYHMIIIDPGVYEDRAGLLYGPFSPIYGVGGVMITIALNRFHKSNPVVVFLAAAFIGAAFEYLVSWWMETSFGITAWDYTGTFLNIDGRTNFKFFCMWGCLGIVWLRWILPKLLALINRIPWNWRYSLTMVATALMLVDCGLTLASLDRWFERQADMGDAPVTAAIEGFCDEHYDDEFMENRFQTMSIDPDEATRVG